MAGREEPRTRCAPWTGPSVRRAWQGSEAMTGAPEAIHGHSEGVGGGQALGRRRALIRR